MANDAKERLLEGAWDGLTLDISAIPLSPHLTKYHESRLPSLFSVPEVALPNSVA